MREIAEVLKSTQAIAGSSYDGDDGDGAVAVQTSKTY